MPGTGEVYDKDYHIRKIVREEIKNAKDEEACIKTFHNMSQLKHDMIMSRDYQKIHGYPSIFMKPYVPDLIDKINKVVSITVKRLKELGREDYVVRCRR